MNGLGFRAWAALLALAVSFGCSDGGSGDSTPSAGYGISGTVTGTASAGVTVLLAATGKVATTDPSGKYTFSGIANGEYTVTPSKDGHVFDPVSIAVTVNGADVAGQDFTSTAAAATYTLSGIVAGATGVTMTLSGDASGTFTASGAYTTGPLAAGGEYTLTPTKVGYTFSPPSATFDALAASATGVDFTATLNTYTISGTVTGATGVMMTVSGDASATFTANGAYTSGPLGHGGTYTITPSKAGYSFTPASATFDALSADATGADFNATLNTYTISGTISGVAGGTTGVTMTISGDASATFTANGTYTSDPLPHGGTFTIAPTKPGYSYEPSSATITGMSANATASFVASVATVPTYTLSGRISGPYVDGIPIALGGDASRTTVSAANGSYRFDALPAGTYTVTPFREGYSFSPSTEVVIANADVTRDIAQTSTVPSYGISGTIAYGGALQGRIYVWASSCGSGDCRTAGTSVVRTGASTSYTIRGLAAGTYTVHAALDNVGFGVRNATNPTGQSASPVYVSSNVANHDLAMYDPGAAAPAAPSAITVFPTSGAAFVMWEPPYDGDWVEVATSYRISWGTDAGASNGGSAIVPARDDPWRVVPGLVDGSTNYFKVSSIAGSDESPAILSGRVAIGVSSSGRSVSGNVTRPPGVTGHLYVVVTDDGAVFEWTQVENPAALQPFTVAGLPDGRYVAYVLLDVNRNGYFDAGDLQTTAPVTVAGADVGNVDVALAAISQDAKLTTQHGIVGGTGGEWFNVVFDVEGRSKLPVAVTVLSGKNIRLPMDLPKDWSFQAWVNTGVRPAPGDAYTVRTTYSDGTTETTTLTVSRVLDTFARNLSEQTTAPGTAAAPLFRWEAPFPAPAGEYTYRVGLFGNANWWFPDGEVGLPSGVTSARYNEDGNASPAALWPGTYTWYVNVVDQDGNEAQVQKTYTVAP